MNGDNNPPQRRTCGATVNYHQMLELVPEFRARQMALESFTEAMPEAAPEGPARIKVVVHVVHNTQAQNISDAQIRSQITVLNQDFRATNSDLPQVPSVWAGLAADANIEFELATEDPDGNPTTGITRTSTTVTSFGMDDRVKFAATGGADAWPTDRYLNIWVCQLAGSLLGYAQFPGGPVDTDGVVILHTAFGTTGTAAAPFNLGRTTVHEVGHFFNLIHIWGDTNDCSGTDHVADTPPAELPNQGTPTFPHLSACSIDANGDMFMNYMDYVDDVAMFMFTTGQVQRMRAALMGARASLIS